MILLVKVEYEGVSMSRARSISLVGAVLGLGLAFLAGAPRAHAGEADDLQRMIDVGKTVADDLERLDDQKAARVELTLLRVWLNTAWTLRSDQRYDEVRVVLDRTQAQGDMIRQQITAAKLSRDAAQKEAELAKLRDDIAKTKQAIQAATLQKAALEGSKGQ
jgi:hypothetical protein